MVFELFDKIFGQGLVPSPRQNIILFMAYLALLREWEREARICLKIEIISEALHPNKVAMV